MDTKQIVELYSVQQMSLREIAGELKTNHKLIGRILVRNGIQITKRNKLRVFTEEHKKKISESRKRLKENGWIPYNRGIKVSKDELYKNMKGHLKYDVSLEWLKTFDDIEKLKLLNRSLSRKRDCEGFTSEIYISFIEKFYYDEQLNNLYAKWVETKDKWMKPSLDHIQAKCKGGKLNILNNLQFISWFENRAKMDIDNIQWQQMKQKINEYL